MELTAVVTCLPNKQSLTNCGWLVLGAEMVNNVWVVTVQQGMGELIIGIYDNRGKATRQAKKQLEPSQGKWEEIERTTHKTIWHNNIFYVAVYKYKVK